MELKAGLQKFVLGAMMLCVSSAAHAQSEDASTYVFDKIKLSASATVDYYSMYVWRGFTLDTDPVIQPGVNISGYGFTVSYWGSHDCDNNDLVNSAETDAIVDYTYALTDAYSVSVGHTYYDFPGGNTYSREFYVGVSASEIPGLKIPISIAFKFFRDYGDQNHGGGLGNYFSTDFSYSTILMESTGIALNAGLHVGYNRKLFIRGKGTDVSPSLGISVPLTKNLTATPAIKYSKAYGDVRSINDGNQKARWFGGISLAGTF